MSKEIKINGVNVASLSDEQKANIAAILGIGVENIKIGVAKVKEVNNLQMKDGSENIAIDRFSGNEFDISQLSEEELANARKTGLSPVSFSKMQEGEAIRKTLKGLSKARGPRNAVSAGQKIRDIIDSYADKIDESAMAAFLDADKSKALMKLRYPLFIEIPASATESQKKEMRKVNGDNRFLSTVYKFDKIPNKSFFMTNDLYERNINLVTETFKTMFDTPVNIEKPAK